MSSRKMSVQIGQAKKSKYKKKRTNTFKGTHQGRAPAELLSLAVAETRKAAEGGDIRAQYLLGLAYAEGSGVQQDLGIALQWLLRAAEQGLPDAQCRVAAMYQTGTGCVQDKECAARWWRMAAEQKDAVAQYCYGLALFRGDGVERDQRKGFDLLRLAAKQGLPEASTLLRTEEMITFALQY